MQQKLGLEGRKYGARIVLITPHEKYVVEMLEELTDLGVRRDGYSKRTRERATHLIKQLRQGYTSYGELTGREGR